MAISCKTQKAQKLTVDNLQILEQTRTTQTTKPGWVVYKEKPGWVPTQTEWAKTRKGSFTNRVSYSLHKRVVHFAGSVVRCTKQTKPGRFGPNPDGFVPKTGRVLLKPSGLAGLVGPGSALSCWAWSNVEYWLNFEPGPFHFILAEPLFLPAVGPRKLYPVGWALEFNQKHLSMLDF